MAQAAEVLRVTERHAWRSMAAYRREGAAALAHGTRGRQPPNTVSDDLATAVVNLADARYSGANPTHLTESLPEKEGFDLGRQTVRRILDRAGLPSPKRSHPPKHRVRRDRMPRAGTLIQVDGGHHLWLGERGPRFIHQLAGGRRHLHGCQRRLPTGRGRPGYFILIDGLIRR